jgi:hypothetical protein
MTKKMPALFAKHPPKKPIVDLKTLVDDWIYRFGAKGVSKQMRDEVVDHCAASRNYREAVGRAVDSVRPNGKMHNHQSRIPRSVKEKFYKAIDASEAAYKAKNFDQLHDVLESLAPAGIGPVTIYDVATRIAAYKKLEIRSLYLHAGVRIGWCLLHGKRSPSYTMRIPREELPKELQRLPTDEVEDMLCAYREVLQPWCAK